MVDFTFRWCFRPILLSVADRCEIRFAGRRTACGRHAVQLSTGGQRMRYGILAVAVVTAFAVASGPSYAQADAKAIIEKAIAAHGGKELLDKYPASRNKFKGELSILGMDISFEGTSVQAP